MGHVYLTVLHETLDQYDAFVRAGKTTLHGLDVIADWGPVASHRCVLQTVERVNIVEAPHPFSSDSLQRSCL